MIPDLELLGRLRDLHPPGEPSWWPPAPGWWIGLVLLAALGIVALRFGPAWWRRQRLRRALNAAFDAIARRHRDGAPDSVITAEISQLLRRAALARFPEAAPAGLCGEDWVAFLEACDHGAGRIAAVREALTVAPYRRPGSPADAAPLLAAARGWLRSVL